MVQSGLIGWWPLAEASGRANDLSGNDNHGSVLGDISQGVAGKGGLTAYGFRGTDGRVSLGKSDDLYPNDALTASIWIRNRDSNNREIFSYRLDANPYEIWEIQSGASRIIVDDGTSSGDAIQVNSGTQNKLNEWLHLILVFSRQQQILKMYTNGELVGEKNIGGDYPLINPGFNGTTDKGAFIGASKGGLREADAVLADARLYNRALSPQEIQHLYEIGSVDVATPPAEEDSAAVARYEFDDRSDTTTALDSFGSNDGTINGATYSADSIRGLSMEFTRSNSEYISIPDDATLDIGAGEVTVTGWIKVNSTGGDAHYIFSKRDAGSPGYQLYVTGGGDFRGGIDDGTNQAFPTGNAINPNVWYFFGLVRDNTNDELRLYLNGVENASQDASSVGDVSNNVTAYIGRKDTSYADGFIDDVRIYDRALSDEEIQQLYLWGTRGTDRRYEVLQQ